MLEALTAMAIGSLALGTAIPALTGTIQAAHAAGARAGLLEGLTRSIAHAALTGSEVVLCPGSAATGCRGSIDWSHGWMAWADLDGDRIRDPGETLLLQNPALAEGVHLRSTVGRTRLVFQPSGGNAGSNVTFTLCDRRGPARAVTLVLSNEGRLRASAPSATAARDCMASLPR